MTIDPSQLVLIRDQARLAEAEARLAASDAKRVADALDALIGSTPEPEPEPEPDPHPHPGGNLLPDPPGAIQTVRDGEATDPSVWEGGIVPQGGTPVIVRHNLTIDEMFRSSYAIIRPDGMVTTQPDSWWDLTGSLSVEGKLHAASSHIEFFHADDRTNFGNVLPGFPRPIGWEAHPDLPDYAAGDVGLWAMPGGEIKAGGPEVTGHVPCVPRGNWGRMSDFWGTKYGVQENPDVENGFATLAFEPAGWQIDDTILVARVHRDGKRRPERRYWLTTLKDITGVDVILERAVTTTAKRRAGKEVPTYLVNLTRRCRVNSALVTKDEDWRRAHCLFFHHSHIHLHGVEFRNLGPKTKPGSMGRYPIHWHHGKAMHDDGAMGCSVWSPWSPSNRALVLHRTDGQRVTDGCFFNHRGHGLMMEEQNEKNHVLDNIFGSTGIDVEPDQKLPLFRDADDGKHRPQSEVFSDVELPGAHQFWLFAGPVGAENRFSNLVGHGGGQMGVLFDRADQSGDPPVFPPSLSIANDSGPWTAMRGIVESPVVMMGEDGSRIDASGFRDAEKRVNEATQKIIGGSYTVWNHHVNDYTSRQVGTVEGGSSVGNYPDVFNSHEGGGRHFYRRNLKCKTLIRPIFQHAFSLVYEECDIEAEFIGEPWTRDADYIYTTPLVRIIECSGTIGNRVIDRREFWVPKNTARYLGWDVTPGNEWWSRLNFEPEPMGFVQLQAATFNEWNEKNADFKRLWNLRGVGADVPPVVEWGVHYREVMKRGVLKDAPHFGSGQGILPGTYLVRLQGWDGFEAEVTVRPGETVVV